MLLVLVVTSTTVSNSEDDFAASAGGFEACLEGAAGTCESLISPKVMHTPSALKLSSSGGTLSELDPLWATTLLLLSLLLMALDALLKPRPRKAVRILEVRTERNLRAKRAERLQRKNQRGLATSAT